MKNFTDNLLRFMGYMIVVILILVACIVAYLVYSFISNPKLENPNDTEPLTHIEQDLQKELNKSGTNSQSNLPGSNSVLNQSNKTIESDANNTSTPQNNSTSTAPASSNSTYNPFEDTSQPIVEPNNNKRSPLEESLSKSDDNKNSKPIDPTSKNQPNLDVLF